MLPAGRVIHASWFACKPGYFSAAGASSFPPAAIVLNPCFLGAGRYHPGMDEVILRPDGKGRVLMDILQVLVVVGAARLTEC